MKEDRTEAGWESRKKTSQQPSEPGGDHISAAGPSSSRLSLKSSRSAELASEVWSATSTASPASPESYTSKKPSSLFSSASPEFLTKRISSNSARPFALIDLGFKVLKTSRSFQTLIDTSSDLRGLRLASLLGTQQDQDVAQLLQCQIMDERTEKEPGYRAPNYSMGEQEAVKSVTVSDIATVTQDYTSREVALSFNMPGGQRQSFDCTFRLARTNIFFIVLLLPPQVVFATAANTAASHLPSLKGTSFPPVSNVSATPRRELSSVIVSGSGPSSSQYRLNARPMSIPSPPITSGHAGPSRASQTPPPAGSYGRGYRAYNEVESSSSARAESASYPHIRILPLLPSSLPPLGSHESAFVASTAEIISPPSTTSVTSDTGSTKNIAGMLQTGDRATENLILPPIGSQNARKPTTAVPGFSSLTQWESGASSTKVTTAASLPLTKSARQRSVEADEDPQRQPKRQRLNIHDVLD